MSRYSSNFEFSSDMTKKLIFGHLASLGPHKRRPSGHWVLYRSPLKGLGSFFTLTPIEKFRRGPKSNFWPLWDTPPWGSLSEPSNNNIYPWNKQVFLSHLLRGYGSVILPQFCHLKHFLFSTHLAQSQGPHIGHLGPQVSLSEPPNNNIYHEMSMFSWATY